ncbi:endonuclease/exonuclease/phosphatase family protein [Rhodobacteraceae bacterium N5(2021)]|uniref:Endonuclease/exonuclease/phosphatase family protein n=1 Tax=Gymnodinialimonas phycosphaerae TaxID=2841589 RepID=A0A975TY09_9RHOB|nr:endonuclease/exonuclease/phosphatase family protein [Gymnodinialimonas phycosphaerae]MBY4892505.1 endonuclease/exonuclease/phosphatase family protein [Gymnodinialimonas phycosphaerae]
MSAPGKIAIASYNIRKAIGRDGRRNPRRILDVIANLSADVVVLQEADFRFGGRRPIFDADELQSITGLRAVDVAPDVEGLGWHGNVLLLRPDAAIQSVKAVPLQGSDPRGAVVSDLDLHGRSLQLIHGHLGLLPHQRARQATLLAAEISHTPTVILGDFNAAGPRPPSLRGLSSVLNEVVHGATFPTRWPCLRFDRMFHCDGLAVSDPMVVDTPLTRVASDHLPIKATFHWT